MANMRHVRSVNGLQYFLTDHLGSTVAVTNASGTLTSQQRYLPFGGVRSNPTIGSITQTDLTYTGQRALDPGMGGLMDYHARFYDPYLNHFIQPDTITPSGTQSLNRFSYVNNNPLRNTDPTGHRIVDGCSELAGGCGDLTDKVKLDDLGKANDFRQTTERNQCKAGNKLHCSYAENHPVETGTFIVGGLLTAGALPEIGVIGDALYTAAGTTCLSSPVCVALTGMAGGAGAYNPASQASSSQGTAQYPGVDDWENDILEEGSTVWGGEPGQGPFYTSDQTMESAGNDATKISQGLQIGRGDYTSFRPGMTQYVLTQTVSIARSIALANPQYGSGGYEQYYIPNYQEVLQPIFTILLNHR